MPKKCVIALTHQIVVTKMKTVIYLILAIVYTMSIARLYYVRGFNDAQFDREVANNKLLNCLQTMTSK